MNKPGVHALVWVGGWTREERDRAVAKTVKIGRRGRAAGHAR